MMKSLISGLVGLVLGMILGWATYYFVVVKKQKDILRETGVTEREAVEAIKKLPELWASMEQDDQMAAVIALAALRKLEEDDRDGAKTILMQAVSGYYSIHGPLDDVPPGADDSRRELLRRIEREMKENPELRDLIHAN